MSQADTDSAAHVALMTTCCLVSVCARTHAHAYMRRHSVRPHVRANDNPNHHHFDHCDDAATATTTPHHSLGRDERNFCGEKEAREMRLSGVLATCASSHNATWCEKGVFTKGQSCKQFCSNANLKCTAAWPLKNTTDCAAAKKAADMVGGTGTGLCTLTTHWKHQSNWIQPADRQQLCTPLQLGWPHQWGRRRRWICIGSL